VIALEAERLRNLKITDETLASEKQVVLEERRMRTEDSPVGPAFEAMLALAFQRIRTACRRSAGAATSRR
jgi:zinc protease